MKGCMPSPAHLPNHISNPIENRHSIKGRERRGKEAAEKAAAAGVGALSVCWAPWDISNDLLPLLPM